MRYGLPDERLGLRHLARILGRTAEGVNGTALLAFGDVVSTDLVQVCHQILVAL